MTALTAVTPGHIKLSVPAPHIVCALTDVLKKVYELNVSEDGSPCRSRRKLDAQLQLLVRADPAQPDAASPPILACPLAILTKEFKRGTRRQH